MSRIIKTDKKKFIRPEDGAEPDKSEQGKHFVWGFRWNKNEQKFGSMCTGHWFKSFEWVEEAELPGKPISPYQY